MTRILFVAAMILGFGYLFVAIHVLYNYEIKTKKTPLAFNFWGYNPEMKILFPNASKWGRSLFLSSISNDYLAGTKWFFCLSG